MERILPLNLSLLICFFHVPFTPVVIYFYPGLYSVNRKNAVLPVLKYTGVADAGKLYLNGFSFYCRFLMKMS